MQCIDVVRELVAFDSWANHLVARPLAGHDAPERANELFAHILAAQTIWLRRIHSEDVTPEPWPQAQPESYDQQIEGLHRQLLRLLDHEDPATFDRPIHYRSPRGETFVTPLREILMHLMYHGTHHRAQIVGAMKGAGIQPPAIDFIVFVRERRGNSG